NYTIEGYLFPDTYEFPVDVQPEQVIRIMAARFNSLIPARYEQSSQKDRYSLHQVVTMASIVEKEAVKQDERARIAGVFYSRLRLQMNLESCATVQYILGAPRKLYFVDLEIVSPYNTYRNPGLPPGPIASAGLASIEAALNPEEHDYLFFVAKSDGSHIFSKTYNQHLSAIQQARR
ncbi:MAG: endolytic transglycosylase MltG, partial [Bacillota bacterium]|nr:endolytic transglycosylase MltG [Bacillota bacterium]